MMVTNQEFLSAIFGENSIWCHVTDFNYDPGQIPKDKQLISWMGDYFNRYSFQPNSNQYFTISLFYCDDQQQARRRKALFRETPCIVLDDVKEKLSMVEVNKLPSPSWILETSQGSEQWGYILDTPCADRSVVENLLDGLVANGLVPGGRDPGMKGVTRYVRLPEGINNKASKLVNGRPFQCRLLKWEPFNRVTIESLAVPFSVDLNAPRRESRTDGAADVSDHPLINIPEIIHIKEVRSDGRFDIICPWVSGHTGADDSGAAVFTNSDGTIGFKCHHGTCQSRTGADLLRHVDNVQPGFSATLKNWQMFKELGNIAPVNFIDSSPVVTTPVESVSFIDSSPALVPTHDSIQLFCDNVRRHDPLSKDARDAAEIMLKHVDDLPKMEQKHWHNQVTDMMNWTKPDFKEIIGDLRKKWYGEKVSSSDFYDNVVFVKELNQFYDFESSIFFSTEAFQNSHSHEDAEARKIALQDGRVQKVDKLDYAPRQPRLFVEKGCRYGNMWSEASQEFGTPGDASRWVDHFDALGWEDHMSHIEKWMSYTIRYPEKKINHMILLGGAEGVGKDFLLYPLFMAMGDNHTTISGEELLEGFNDYVLSTKYLHINEAELGDRREALAVTSKLKPLASAPPDTLSVNQKGVKRVHVRNIINATMSTNSAMPLRLSGTSRRYYAVWTDLRIRDSQDNVTPAWLAYWSDRWDWMKGEGAFAGCTPGWQYVIDHLMNVDLLGFSPAAAPKMTEFLREIKDSSKSSILQTLEHFIEKRYGCFRSNIVTAKDVGATVRDTSRASPTDMLADPKFFTDKKIGMVFKESGDYKFVRGGRHRMWIVNDIHKYLSMSSGQIQDEYEKEIKKINGGQLNNV